MKTARLKLIYQDDIKRVFVDIADMEPLRIRCSEDIELLIKNVRSIQIEFYEDDKIVRKNVDLVEIKGNILELKILPTAVETIDRKDYRSDYKGIIYIKKLEGDDFEKFQKCVESENARLKSTLLNKMKELLTKSEDSKSYIIEYLIELNSKLDRIINLLEKTEEKQHLETAMCVDIGGGGLCFFKQNLGEEYNIEDKLYIKVELNELSHYVHFSTIATIVNKDRSEKGCFYGVHFDTIDSDFREETIRYVLEKDRDLLRQFRLK